MRSRRSRKLSHTQTSVPCGTLNQGHIMTLHTYTSQPITRTEINFQHFTDSKILLQVKMLQVKGTMPRSNQGHTIILHTYIPLSMSQPSTMYQLMVSQGQTEQDFKIKIIPCPCTLTNPNQFQDKILKIKVTMTRSEVKSMSCLHPPTSVTMKHELPIPSSFCNLAWTRF